MEFEEKPLMVNLVKGFTEIHDYDICLSIVIKQVREVLGKLDQLCFATQFISEIMLILKKQLVFIQVWHYVGGYHMFKDFTTDTDRRDGSVIFCLACKQVSLRHYSSHQGPHLLPRRY